MREICMLRSTRRGLETRHGRDGVTLADERARQRGTQTSTYTGAPVLDPTDERGRETERVLPSPATASVLDSTREGAYFSLRLFCRLDFAARAISIRRRIASEREGLSDC